MSRLVSIIVLVHAIGLFLSSCSTVKQENETSRPGTEHMILGWTDRQVFSLPEYRVFAGGYDTATVAAEFVELLRQVQDDVEMVVFFGSWCSDSKHQIPKFLKISDAAGIPSARIRFYGLDRTKTSSDGLTAQYGIELVPTFIFLRNGDEIGRIVEKPAATMEADMLSILARPGQ